MSKKHKKTTVYVKYKNLKDRYDEMQEYLRTTVRENCHLAEELRYRDDFIKYNDLEYEYDYFRKHAHETEKEDQLFPVLTL